MTEHQPATTQEPAVHHLTCNSFSQTYYTEQHTPCLKKLCKKLFLSELRQISTNFDNFWQKDGKETEIMQDALIFHFN